jgi:hypothetical protein
MFVFSGSEDVNRNKTRERERDRNVPVKAAPNCLLERYDDESYTE